MSPSVRQRKQRQQQHGHEAEDGQAQVPVGAAPPRQGHAHGDQCQQQQHVADQPVGGAQRHGDVEQHQRGGERGHGQHRAIQPDRAARRLGQHADEQQADHRRQRRRDEGGQAVPPVPVRPHVLRAGAQLGQLGDADRGHVGRVADHQAVAPGDGQRQRHHQHHGQQAEVAPEQELLLIARHGQRRAADEADGRRVGHARVLDAQPVIHRRLGLGGERKGGQAPRHRPVRHGHGVAGFLPVPGAVAAALVQHGAVDAGVHQLDEPALGCRLLVRTKAEPQHLPVQRVARLVQHGAPVQRVTLARHGVDVELAAAVDPELRMPWQRHHRPHPGIELDHRRWRAGQGGAARRQQHQRQAMARTARRRRNQ